MQTVENGQALAAMIRQTYELYRKEFETIEQRQANQSSPEEERTPSQNVAYQIGWIRLLLSWEAQEQAGQSVETPAPGIKWNQLGKLYRQFYADAAAFTLKELLEQLDELVEQCCQWVESLDASTLFEPGQRQWATTKAQWPVWKWVHINTVAPFKTFRTKIRKWKKTQLRID